ncbi:MAG: AmmeMemoRadiSam system protein A [Bdellovibrionota bacterium]
MLSGQEKKALLAIARTALAHKLVGGPSVSPPDVPTNSELLAPRGAFVTLHTHGELRGCIGIVEAAMPLWKIVAENAVAAATRDPRFPPLEAEELPQTDIEISALSRPIPVQQPEEIEIGRDGLIIENGRRKGLLLPQVATEWGFGREEFLQAVCEKAWLPRDAWRDPFSKLQRFTAEVFGEK